MADEHPFPTCLLNHETSDHLLSLVDSQGRMNHRDSRHKSCFDFFLPLEFSLS